MLSVLHMEMAAHDLDHKSAVDMEHGSERPMLWDCISVVFYGELCT